MRGDEGSEGLGMAIALWLLLVMLTGGSIFACIFLLFAVFWILPKIWEWFISRTFEDDFERIMLFVAAFAAILAIYCLL